MKFQALALILFCLYWTHFGFAVFNLCQGDWITRKIGAVLSYGLFRACGIVSGKCDKAYAESFQIKWARFLMVMSVILAFFGFAAFAVTAAGVKKKEVDDKVKRAAQAISGFFVLAAIKNLIGQSVWTGYACYGECDRFYWNWSYYTGWISTFILFLLAAVGSIIGKNVYYENDL